MVFTTLEFIVFFATVFVAYWALPSRGRWGLLLAASWFFYAWASPYYLIFLGVTTGVTYLAAVGMDAKRISRKWGGVGAAVVTIGMLVVFKYLEFLFANVNWLMGAAGVHAALPAVKLLLPIGLSFYVFQSLGYCIDVQREVVSAERNFFKHALFVSYFPQILQGPIGDYGRLAPQLFEAKTFNYGQAVYGIQRVAWGFFKKVMIANIIADRINPVWSAVGDYPGLICWSAILVLVNRTPRLRGPEEQDFRRGRNRVGGLKFVLHVPDRDGVHADDDHQQDCRQEGESGQEPDHQNLKYSNCSNPEPYSP